MLNVKTKKIFAGRFTSASFFGRVFGIILVAALLLGMIPGIGVFDAITAKADTSSFSLKCADIFGNPIAGMQFTAFWSGGYKLTGATATSDLFASNEFGIVTFPESLATPFSGTIQIELSPAWVTANSTMLENTVFGMSPLGGVPNPDRNDGYTTVSPNIRWEIKGVGGVPALYWGWGDSQWTLFYDEFDLFEVPDYKKDWSKEEPLELTKSVFKVAGTPVTVASPNVKVGDIIEYKFTIQNPNRYKKNFKLIDYLPDGLSFDPSINPGWTEETTGTLVYNGTVYPNSGRNNKTGDTVNNSTASAVVYLRLCLDTVDLESIRNRAKIEWERKKANEHNIEILEPGTTAEEAADIITAEYDVALCKWVAEITREGKSIAKYSEGNSTVAFVHVGDKVVFGITLYNQTNSATWVTRLVDFVPSGYTFVDADNTDWTESGGEITYAKPIFLSGTGSETVYITLNVADSADYVNWAEVKELKNNKVDAGDNVPNIVVCDKDSDNPAVTSMSDSAYETDNKTDDNWKGGVDKDKDDLDFAEVQIGDPPSENPPSGITPYPENPPPSDPPPSEEPPPPELPPEDSPPDDSTPTSPPTHVPGGTDQNTQPTPTTPGNTMVLDGDSWMEYDENGVPLGIWTWDEELEEWIFQDDIPLGYLPPTGDAGAPVYLIFLMGASLLGIGLTLKFGRRKRGGR